MARSRKKYAEAEPLLVQGCERRLKHKDKLPPRDMVLLRESLDRLVQLYDATGRKDEAARYRKELDALLKAAKELPKK